MREVKETCDYCGTSFNNDYSLVTANLFLGSSVITMKKLKEGKDACPNCIKRISNALIGAYTLIIKEITNG